MATRPHVLLLGGNGRVSRLLTPRMLARGWNVTSIIRDPLQTEGILALRGEGHTGELKVLVRSLDDVKSDEDARKGLEEAGGVDWVVWGAGAGGKGGPERTYAIDRDAAKHYIRASIDSPRVKKFLMISALSSRRQRASWWNDEDWQLIERMNKEIIPDYYKAKLEADEYLTALAKRRNDTDPAFQSILLRPGGLSEAAETGKVTLGKTRAKGMVTRGDVAETAVRLLEREDTRGWFDVLSGNHNVASAVEAVVKEGVDSIEGEDVEAIYKRYL